MEQKAWWLERGMVAPIASAVRKQEVDPSCKNPRATSSNPLPTTNLHLLNVP